MPQRIQRKRTKGWRMPSNTVYVGRPSRWGNRCYSRGFFDDEMERRANDVREPRVQVVWFREFLENMRASMPDIYEQHIAPLRGKDLACWCKPGAPCHADVLLEFANEGKP